MFRKGWPWGQTGRRDTQLRRKQPPEGLTGEQQSERTRLGPEQGIIVSVWDTERRLVGLEHGERVGWDRRWLSWKPGGPQCAEPWKAKQRHGFCSKENGNKVMLPDTAHGLTAGNNFPFLCYSTQSTSKAAISFMILVAWIFWSPDLQRGCRWVASSRQHLKTTKCLPC